MDFTEFVKRYKKRLYEVCIDKGLALPNVDENRLGEIYLAMIVIRDWDNEQLKKDIERSKNQ